VWVVAGVEGGGGCPKLQADSLFVQVVRVSDLGRGDTRRFVLSREKKKRSRTKGGKERKDSVLPRNYPVSVLVSFDVSRICPGQAVEYRLP
jgi:hypothetical protein